MLDPLFRRSLHPQQSGFTKNRSTLDAILTLRLLSKIHREFRKPLHVAYVDLKAAFDSVDRLALWKALQGVGAAPDILVDLIQSLREGSSSRVRYAGKLSALFHTTSGVKARLHSRTSTVLSCYGYHHGTC